MENTALKRLWLLLIPSWLSGFFCAAGSLVAVVGTAVASRYQGSSLQQSITQAHQAGATLYNFNFQDVTNRLAQNQAVSNLPLFLFWAAMGVVVYFLAINLLGSLGHAVELEQELNYVNTSRPKLVRTILLEFVVRVGAVLLWIGYTELFLHLLLPYVLAVAQIAAGLSPFVTSIGYGALGLAVAFVALQLHVVFLRLVFLRVRVINSTSIE